MGYDLCLFEDEDVDEELICPICRGVLGLFLSRLSLLDRTSIRNRSDFGSDKSPNF